MMSPNPNSALGRAAEHYRAGRFTEVAASLDAHLAAAPGDHAVWFSLGQARYRQGQFGAAVEAYREALRLAPDQADYVADLGTALKADGRQGEAEAMLREARRRVPANPLPAMALAGLLLGQRRLGEAEGLYRTLISADPVHAGAVEALATVLLAESRPGEAVAVIEAYLALRPDDEKLEALFATALSNHGNALGRLGRHDEAVAAHERAIAAQPQSAAALANLGISLRDQGRMDEAVAAHEKAIAAQPDFARAHANLANALHQLGRHAEAEAAIHTCLGLDPDNAHARFLLGILYLLKGEHKAGWRDYEARMDLPDIAPRLPGCPRWDGTPLDGTLLLQAEQGVGDTIHFVRFLPWAKARVRTLVVTVHAPLIRLLQQTFKDITFLPHDGPLVPAHYDAAAPLLSVPLIMGLERAGIPSAQGYLSVSARAQLPGAERAGLRVGLVWAGNPAHANDAARSLSVGALLPVLSVPGVSWYSLQVPSALPTVPEGVVIADLGPTFGDYLDTAGAILALDLVITVDTSVAHLAGALGREAWVLVPFVPDWRWMLERTDTDWYTSLRLFRQRTRGDWAPVIAEIATALAARVEMESVGMESAGAVVATLADQEQALALAERAVSLHDLGRYGEAEAAFLESQALDPGNAINRSPLGMLRLLRGDFASGWQIYEARLDTAEQQKRLAGLPRWDGKPLDGRLLLHAEQGFGDTLQFARFLPFVATQAKGLTVIVQKSLVRLLQQSFPDIEFLPRGVAPVPAHYAAVCPMLSLGLLAGINAGNVPSANGYLAPPALMSLAAEAGAGLRVGLVWSGNPAHAKDAARSIEKDVLAPLLAVRGVSWFSLQVPAARLPTPDGVAMVELGARFGDFHDTAAAIMALDLVISVDTAVVHLAGALGKEAWVLLPLVPDWRWLLERRDTPWYASLRLFRQQALGNWEPVIADVALALAARVAAASTAVLSVICQPAK